MAVQRPTRKPLRVAQTASANKKGRPKPPWFLPTAAVPRDEVPPLRVRI
jgi:hypothetical protein